jgi:hypothetical protein
MQQLANSEAELKLRDEMSKAEADRRLTMIETQRREAMEELSRYRERVERGLSEERFVMSFLSNFGHVFLSSSAELMLWDIIVCSDELLFAM